MERYQTNHRAIRWRGGLPHKAHRWIFLIQIGDLPCHQGTSSIVLGITIIKTTSLRHIIECLVLTSTISELPIQITSPFLHQIQVEIGVGGVGENLIKHFRYLVFKMQIFIFIFCKLRCMISLKISFYKHIYYGRYLYSNNISKNIVESWYWYQHFAVFLFEIFFNGWARPNVLVMLNPIKLIQLYRTTK